MSSLPVVGNDMLESWWYPLVFEVSGGYPLGCLGEDDDEVVVEDDIIPGVEGSPLWRLFILMGEWELDIRPVFIVL